MVVWQAVEQAGGVVPEIEEDRTQAPPAWWRYPSALRSEVLLDAEAKNATLGLYGTVAATALAKGDILVRTRGQDVGVCGKMALLGAQVDGQWITMEVGPDGRGPSTRPASPLFFAADGVTLLPQTRAFRIRVKKDETIGHIRELRRDLDHLERTVGNRPPRLAPGDEAKETVTERVHDLVDEAWSLVADESFDADRRELAARALILGAHLDWPGAAVSARAVLDDVLKKAPGRATSLALQASLGPGPGGAREASQPGEPAIRHFATADEAGVVSTDLAFQIRWPLTWRLLGLAANPETGVLANLMTGRVLLSDGHADRAAAVILAQRPANTAARASLVRDGARKMFPAAKMKTLPPIVPGSRRQQFRERQEGSQRAGEITTIDRGGVVTFLVLNAPAEVYPKLREEYTAFVRSLSPPTPPAPPNQISQTAASRLPPPAPSLSPPMSMPAGSGGAAGR